MKRSFRSICQVIVLVVICLLLTATYLSSNRKILSEKDFADLKDLPYLREILSSAGHGLKTIEDAKGVPHDQGISKSGKAQPKLPVPVIPDMKYDADPPGLTDVEVVLDTKKALQSIMKPSSISSPSLECPAITTNRYDHLKPNLTYTYAMENKDKKTQRKWFFALDLFECASLLPRLLGSVVEVLHLLGPENCAISIVEGRSEDGTREILQALKTEILSLGAEYYLTYNEVSPKSPGVNRIAALADLRNQALLPLIHNTNLEYAPDTQIIYINDISLCPIDILELLHQQVTQNIDMACAMDWINDAECFYDVWVSRTVDGDTFFEIPQDASWAHAANLFWSSPLSKERFEARQPFQVYACWNGITTISAEPFMKHLVQFRASNETEGECFMGEPTLLAKDLAKHGYQKTAVVPSVNVGYSDQQSIIVKRVRGSVEASLELAAEAQAHQGINETIVWQPAPQQVKCAPRWEDVSWVPAM